MNCHIHDYKPGEYLECGYGDCYSKILILSADNVIVKEGVGSGEIISLAEWFYIIGENKSTLQNTTYFDNCKGCPFYADHLNNKSKELDIRVPCEIQNRTTIKGILKRTSSIRFNSKEDIIQTEVDRTIKVSPVSKKVEHPWYYKIFICGLFD